MPFLITSSDLYWLDIESKMMGSWLEGWIPFDVIVFIAGDEYGQYQADEENNERCENVFELDPVEGDVIAWYKIDVSQVGPLNFVSLAVLWRKKS